MVKQPDINVKMRGILVDWLIEVHRKFELMPETLYLTINIVDRFLSENAASRRELQLVGISSMLIASKYEEIWAPEVVIFLTFFIYFIFYKIFCLLNLGFLGQRQVNDFVCISDNAYVKEQILVTEKAILEKLGWLLTVPTPYVFLVRYIKASIPSDQAVHKFRISFPKFRFPSVRGNLDNNLTV
jgi:G2/mitotic-specific cyclin-B, other